MSAKKDFRTFLFAKVLFLIELITAPAEQIKATIVKSFIKKIF